LLLGGYQACAATKERTAVKVIGPIKGGALSIYETTVFDLDKVGYEQAEFIYTGTARSYEPTMPLAGDGKWETKVAASEPYGSRMIVYRPSDPKQFNGTVYVEWLNVSSRKGDFPVEWMYIHNEMIRQGAVYVGVSAQAIGVNSAKYYKPRRYQALHHPGDSFSYDMFAQAGMAIRAQTARILPGMKLGKLIAVGHSQSAMRLTTYIDGVHVHSKVFDGFLVHGRFEPSAPLSQAPQTVVTMPSSVQIREDLGVPVFAYQSETEVASVEVRQPDTNFYRLWEVAGTSHADQYNLVYSAYDDGSSVGFGGLVSPGLGGFVSALLQPTSFKGQVRTPSCASPLNGGPNTWVLSAALHHLQAWVASGKPPPAAPRIELANREPLELRRDTNGNAIGGVRTPYVDVPVATLTPLGKPADCRLFGTTEPFPAESLKNLYQTPTEFLAKWTASTDDAISNGFVVAEDRPRLVEIGEKISETIK
jgi:hypothetical protein